MGTPFPYYQGSFLVLIILYLSLPRTVDASYEGNHRQRTPLPVRVPRPAVQDVNSNILRAESAYLSGPSQSRNLNPGLLAHQDTYADSALRMLEFTTMCRKALCSLFPLGLPSRSSPLDFCTVTEHHTGCAILGWNREYVR